MAVIRCEAHLETGAGQRLACGKRDRDPSWAFGQA
jgi:hypothetical protein